MRKGMLITVAGMALLAGTADVRAACIPTQDCASLGYKYTAAQCPDGAIACPFDTSKFFCMNPTDDSGSTTTPDPTPAPSVPTDGYCCGYSGCGYNGTSHPENEICQEHYGMSCYNYCMQRFGGVSCDDMQAKCLSSGGTPRINACAPATGPDMYANAANISCRFYY